MQQLHLMARAFHHRDRDHPRKQRSWVQPPCLSAEGAGKRQWPKTGAARTVSSVSSSLPGTSPAGRWREVALPHQAPVNSWRCFEDDVKAFPDVPPEATLVSQTPPGCFSVGTRSAASLPSLLLAHVYSRRFRAAFLSSSPQGLPVHASVLGRLHAFCGLSLLFE